MRQSLKNYNTFGVDVECSIFYSINQIEDLLALKYNNIDDLFIIGGGSNMLLCNDIHKIVLKNNIKGRSIVNQTDEYSDIVFGGGENWHQCVLWSLEHQLSGMENLSLIPGTCGAAPIQNIGAYGVELKDILLEVHTIELATKETVIFRNEDCDFGYRNSIFKNEKKGQYFITAITVRLSKDMHNINTNYGIIASSLAENNIVNPTAKDVSDIVIHIRESKLPNPAELGNSGSFFKNPIISINHYDALKKRHQSIPSYPIDENTVKVPAAWLIDYCGWKGSKIGRVGNYINQPLILVNYGNASGNEIYNHALNVRQSVKDIFDIELNYEVNIIK